MLKKLDLQSHWPFFVFLSLVLLKFLFVRGLLFENANIFKTIFVEIGYLLLFFGLVELLSSKKLKIILYIALNLIFTVLLLAVLIYHDYFGYIVTVHVFSQIGQVGTVKDSVLQLIKPVYFLIFVDFILLPIYFFMKKKSGAKTAERINLKLVLPIMILGVSLVGYQLFTQRDAKIANTVLAAEKQGILTYEILAVKDKAEAASTPLLTSEEKASLPEKIREIKGIEPIPAENLKLRGIAEGKNLIVIQAEAFQDFTINLKVDGKEITPFLNDLLQGSLYFPNVFQQIGPGNTSDAEFMFNTSLYPSAWTATSETFSDREIPSLPKLLKKEDYQTMTFHANDVTFWSRDKMYPALGFDKYYDIEFFGNEDVIGIGPSDEYVYEKALPELKKLHDSGQKFYAQIVTLSSHHPFKIPDDKKTLQLPAEFDGSIVGDYLKAISYTDAAIEKLVQSLKDEGLWEDTILVLYGDHFGLQPSGLKENDFDLLEGLVNHEYSFLDQFNIPFIVAVGGEKLGEVNEVVGSQLDIMPTVANMLGLSLDDYVHFGQDIVNYPDNLFGMRYYMPVGSFFNNKIVFKPAEGFADGEAFELQSRETLADFSQYEKDYERISELLNLSDEYMNSLPKR
ncbi:LTA synthase family protein [Robertmurraya andreesenii]|uniref:Phosphoglycerol transferase MdoB-like AlkP superfamily enzyme n=1 Tax=Anoxybacillus andreesenii TaxID=1325932 RepID=A0ABT9UZU0_9BACL|nr:LTA synthase family protein [Robertmurraya andreesenii]MDQ0154208.1 phosphoglycerol transferase MdoB-like AlkP superfamily enzyme [Robertmurraya andreesenii]